MTEKMKPSGIAWIGDVPESWNLLKLKYFSYLKGRIGWQGLTADEFIDEGPYLITGTDFENGRIQFDRSYHISEARYAQAPEIQLQIGDLLVTKDGTVGKMAYVDELPGKASLNSHLLLIRPLEGKYHNRFLFWLMSSSVFTGYTEYSQDGTIMASLSQEKIGNFLAYFPDLDEQCAIADVLDAQCAKIDRVIADIEKQIETLQKYKKSLITEAVTKGLDRSAPMKDSGIEWIGCIPAEWDCKKLKYIISESLQYGANEAGDDYREDYPRYIRITDITEENTLKEEGKLSLPPDIAAPYILRDGDILFARSGATVGKTFFYTTNCGLAAFAGYLIRARVNPSMALPRFVYYSTLGVGYENWKNTVFTQATIQNIGADKYAQFFVTLPKLTEQSRIVEYLDEKCTKIDDIIKNKQQQLLTVQQHKKSLIYEYVTGKKRVTEVN